LETALDKEEVRQLSMVRLLREKRGLDEVISWLERELVVDFSVGPEILRIALNGDRPEELKVLVSAVEDAYLKFIANRHNEDAIKHLAGMEALATKYEGIAKSKRENLRKITKELGTKDSSAMLTIRHLNEIVLGRTKMDLSDCQSELRKVEVEAAGLSAKNKIPRAEQTISDRTIDQYAKNDPQGKDILDRKQKIEGNIRDAKKLFNDEDKNPIMAKYRQELADVEAELVAFRKNVRPQLVKELSEKDQGEKQANQAHLKDRIDGLRDLESRLKKDVEVYEKKVEDIGSSTLNIEFYKDELAQADELAKRVRNQVEAYRVELDAPERIKKLEDAYVTHPDEQKRRLMAAGFAGGGALGLVLFVIAWLEMRRQRVNSVDEVVQGLGMKLMGTVPALPSRRQLRLVGSNGQADFRWQNILTESVDTARTMLLHKASSESLRMVMVTSAVGGEGKTSLSSHLAASLARSGRKTLLLDADLRNPAIHRLFGLDRSPGLCELLRGEVELADAIQATPAPGLSLITAGRCDEMALQGLAQDNLRKICEPLRQEFDFIVVDSAPVLPVADSLLIGQMVDGVIFSVLHDVSRLPKVYAAHQRLEMLGIHILGAVVSGAKVDDYGSDYEYGAKVHA
jgi:capsular exopolysaccharide synthesis family protein